jgi:hypothetical protein
MCVRASFRSEEFHVSLSIDEGGWVLKSCN